MKSLISILFHTNSTFEYLDNQYEDRLERICLWIFLFVGAIRIGITPELRPGESMEMINNFGLSILTLISLIYGAFVGVLTGRYLFTYFLYWIGKLLGGVGRVFEIRMVFAYSLIPMIFQLPFRLYFWLLQNGVDLPTLNFKMIEIFYLFLWILHLKILIQGLIRYNNFRMWQSLITISPILIIGFANILLRYVFFRI